MEREGLPSPLDDERPPCALCNLPAEFGQIDWHHVIKRSLAPERRWDVGNLIPLCRGHHELVHSGYIQVVADREANRLQVYREGKLAGIMPIFPVMEWPEEVVLDERPSIPALRKLQEVDVKVLQAIYLRAKEVEGHAHLWVLACVWALWRRVAWMKENERAVAEVFNVSIQDARHLISEATAIFQRTVQLYLEETGHLDEWLELIDIAASLGTDALHSLAVAATLPDAKVERLQATIDDMVRTGRPLVAPRPLKLYARICPNCGYQGDEREFRRKVVRQI